MSKGRDNTYKKFFALGEIIAAMIFCIVEVVGCIRLNGSISDLSESTAGAVNSYITVVDHGKEVFRETYQTIPQHRKTIGEICESLDSLVKVCENTYRMFKNIPNGYQWKWLSAVKEFPLKLYKPLSAMERSMRSSLKVLNTLDEKTYNDTIAAFDGTRKSLENAGKAIPDLSSQLTHAISFMTAFMVFLAVLVFCHGLVRLSECQSAHR